MQGCYQRHSRSATPDVYLDITGIKVGLRINRCCNQAYTFVRADSSEQL